MVLKGSKREEIKARLYTQEEVNSFFGALLKLGMNLFPLKTKEEIYTQFLLYIVKVGNKGISFSYREVGRQFLLYNDKVTSLLYICDEVNRFLFLLFLGGYSLIKAFFHSLGTEEEIDSFFDGQLKVRQFVVNKGTGAMEDAKEQRKAYMDCKRQSNIFLT